MARNYKEGDSPVPGYRLQKFLGRGGFGEVWRASAPGGFEVAIKIINLSGKPGQKELKALQVVKRLRHPNLVAVTAFWLRDEDGNVLPDPEEALAKQTPAPRVQDTMIAPLDDLTTTPASLARPTELVICMGLADQSLFDRLQECQRQGLTGIPSDELLKYMDDAARAIDYLNSPTHTLLGGEPHSVQHCDIKPHNILIVSGAAQVCDFGLARVMGDVQNSSAAAGTIAYAAPECIKEGKPSPQTDQYSLAISYLELKTGALPYDSETWMEVLTAVQQGNLNLSKLPPAEQVVIKRATSPNPAERFPSSMDMMRALHEAVRDGADGNISHIAKTQPAIRGGGTASDGGGMPLGLISAIAAVVLILAGGVGWYAWPRGNGKKVVLNVPNNEKRDPKVDEPPKIVPVTETAKLQAERLKNDRDFGKAVEKYNEWLSEHPTDTAAIFDRGLCYQQLKKLDEALRDFEDAIKQDSSGFGEFATKSAVGEAYLARGALRRMNEDLDGALQDLTAAARFPDLPAGDALFGRGAILLAKKDYESAVKDLEAARTAAPARYQKAPELGAAYVGRGELRLRMNPKDAMADAEAALKFNSKDPLALLLRGTAHLELGDMDKAKADFTSVLVINDQESRALSRRGLIHLQQENYVEAIKDLSFAIKVEEDTPHFIDYFNRGRAYLFQEKSFDRAIEDLQVAAELEPKNALVRFLLGEAHRLNELPQAALAEYAKAIELEKDFAEAYMNSGLVYTALEDYPKAIERFSQAIQLNSPNIEIAYDNRGDAYAKTGMKELAAADMAVKALFDQLADKPEDVAILSKLALTLAASPIDGVRQGAKALELAEAACKLSDSKDPSALAALAAALAELGKYDEAAKHAQAAAELATDAALKTRIGAQLDRYAAKQPWRLEGT